MSVRSRLSFEVSYLGRPPWDSGISPPELLRYLEASAPGRAIDLGCGTGTNAITLARAGWQVTAVDFAAGAIRAARKKARRAGLAVVFLQADVTRLDGIKETFDLALDIGCFHGVSNRRSYMDRLTGLLVPGGSWLLYGFHRAPSDHSGPGLTAADIELAASRLRLVWRTDGADKRQRPSSWFLFRKRAGHEPAAASRQQGA